MSLFNRQVEITVAGFTTNQLRVKFDIEKNTDPESNSADIEIYNLSENTRNQIRELDEPIELRAGYDDDVGPKLIFTGDIVKVRHELRFPDIITRIKANDGIKATREKRSSVSFNTGTNGLTALQDVANKLGLGIRDIPNSISGQYLKGFSYAGTVKDALNKITERLGLEWSVQNNELQVLPKRGTIPGASVLISYAEGLIDAPERLSDLKNNLIEDKPNPGYKVKNLLNPNLEPGGVINLQGPNASGSFRIERVQYRGDNYGGDFLSILEVTEL